MKYSKDFNGSLNDTEVRAVLDAKNLHVANNTYYRYKRELRQNDE